MNRKLTSTLGMAFLTAAVGCGTLNSSTVPEREILRPASEITMPFEAPPGILLGENTCKSPMIDPIDGTEIRMERSFSRGMGEYSVPEGKYGVGRGELLRINCNTGEVIGIVKE